MPLMMSNMIKINYSAFFSGMTNQIFHDRKVMKLSYLYAYIDKFRMSGTNKPELVHHDSL